MKVGGVVLLGRLLSTWTAGHSGGAWGGVQRHLVGHVHHALPRLARGARQSVRQKEEHQQGHNVPQVVEVPETPAFTANGVQILRSVESKRIAQKSTTFAYII